MSSKYWDDFERRINETVNHIEYGDALPVRRVAVFSTNICNFKCSYCNVIQERGMIAKDEFTNIVDSHSDAIIHITGGEPSIIPWLYDFIESRLDIRFHLNTNGYIMPPRNIKRLKVSFDSMDQTYFDQIVSKPGSFEKVVNNIKEASKHTITSLTCTLTKETYRDAPKFMSWCRDTFPDLYAVFFSVYKGVDPRFVFTDKDAEIFFSIVKPELEAVMDKESLELISETIDEKRRIMQNIRFPENKLDEPCYISMSERVYDFNGRQCHCSHLYRDNIFQIDPSKHMKCLYGCNRRLIKFNEDVKDRLIKNIS